MILIWLIVVPVLGGLHFASQQFHIGWLFWVAVALDVVAGILLAITMLGLLCRKAHQVARTIALNQTGETVWQAISDFAGVPGWNKMVVKVERLEDRNGHEVWRETYTGNYPILLETTTAAPPQRLVRTIADENGPFSGRWEFDLAPQEAGCRVTITEFGEVPNPFFRFMARMFMDPAQYIELYLKALAAKFGETAKIETPAAPGVAQPR